jgi:hypothetical protein
MGASFLTSSSGADESPLLSVSDMIAGVCGVVICDVADRESRRRSWWLFKDKEERATSQTGQSRTVANGRTKLRQRKPAGGAAVKHSEDRMFAN